MNGVAIVSFFSRSAWVAEKLTSRPAWANSPSSMPTMTGRSNTWLLGAILTTGRSWAGMDFLSRYFLRSLGAVGAAQQVHFSLPARMLQRCKAPPAQGSYAWVGGQRRGAHHVGPG